MLAVLLAATFLLGAHPSGARFENLGHSDVPLRLQSDPAGVQPRRLRLLRKDAPGVDGRPAGSGLDQGIADRPGCSPGRAPVWLCSERCGSSAGCWGDGPRAGLRWVVMIGSLTFEY